MKNSSFSKTWISSAVSFLVLVVIGCVSSTPPPESGGGVVEALRSGDQEAINQFTRKFLDGKERIHGRWLRDFSKRGIYLRVEPRNRTEAVNHLGVEAISDYFMCLLEIKYKTYTPEIVATAAPQLADSLEPMGCGICCSAVFSVPNVVRSALADYWIASGVVE